MSWSFLQNLKKRQPRFQVWRITPNAKLTSLQFLREPEGNQLFTNRTTSVKKSQFSGVHLSGNEGKVLYAKDFTGWFQVWTNQRIALCNSDIFDNKPIQNYRETARYVQAITRQIFITQLQLDAKYFHEIFWNLTSTLSINVFQPMNQVWKIQLGISKPPQNHGATISNNYKKHISGIYSDDELDILYSRVLLAKHSDVALHLSKKQRKFGFSQLI